MGCDPQVPYVSLMHFMPSTTFKDSQEPWPNGFSVNKSQVSSPTRRHGGRLTLGGHYMEAALLLPSTTAMAGHSHGHGDSVLAMA